MQARAERILPHPRTKLRKEGNFHNWHPPNDFFLFLRDFHSIKDARARSSIQLFDRNELSCGAIWISIPSFHPSSWSASPSFSLSLLSAAVRQCGGTKNSSGGDGIFRAVCQPYLVSLDQTETKWEHGS